MEQETEIRILYAEDLEPPSEPSTDESPARSEILELSFDIPRD